MKALLTQNGNLLDMRHDHFEITKSATPKSKRKSLVFSVERFHEYLYGCKFTVFTNSVFRKSIVRCPALSQKIFSTLRSPHPSRHYKNSKPELDENSLIHHIHFVISNLPISNECLEQFKEGTQKDSIFKAL